MNIELYYKGILYLFFMSLNFYIFFLYKKPFRLSTIIASSIIVFSVFVGLGFLISLLFEPFNLKDIAFRVYVAIFIYILFIFFLKVVRYMIRGISKFHKAYNADNTHREPIKLVVNNEPYVLVGYKAVYWLGSWARYYGVFFE